MHEQFIKAAGGAVPRAGEKREKRSAGERLKKENTLEATKELLLKGLSADKIARERKMALSTIWGHI
jgi:hypothetical protein